MGRRGGYQLRVRGSPKLMQPKMGTETVRPLLPRRRYSHLDCSTDCRRLRGTSFAMVKRRGLAGGVFGLGEGVGFRRLASKRC